MGDGDWNDGMNRVGAEGRGESVWLGWFLVRDDAPLRRALRAMRTRAAEAESWRSRPKSLRATIDASAWDGAWYLRAFHDDGSLLGSAKGRECRIDSIAQSWAVLSRRRGAHDAVGSGRARSRGARGRRAARRRGGQARSAALRRRSTRTLHDPGYIRAYPPGIRENGGQYTHAATWLGWAYVALGDGERAERIFRLLNPILRARTTSAESERYRVEPYVLAGDVYGAPPWVGRGGWTWYTGAAAWALAARRGGHPRPAERGGRPLHRPVHPARHGAGSKRGFASGARRVHVVVDNPDAAGRGIGAVTIDGVLHDSNRSRSTRAERPCERFACSSSGRVVSPPTRRSSRAKSPWHARC